MKLRLLATAIICCLSLISTATFAASDWPSKPVRILVSFPPGGASDLVARLLAKHLTDKFGEQFVVENKPGAGGTVAAMALKREKGDGYTFMLSNLAPYSIAPTQFKELPYDPMKDFTHVSYIGAVHLGLFVSPKLGIKDLKGFVEKAAAEPGVLDFGTSGVGSWGQVIAEQFKRIANVDLVSIPYKGSGPMRLDFRSGVIPVIFDAIPQNIPSMEEGTAVAIAISSTTRSPSTPDIMTFKEQGYDIFAENWLGLTAPAGLDPSIASSIDAAVAEIIALPDVSKQFDTWGLAHDRRSSAEFKAFVEEQIAVWRPLVINAGAVK